ncbi:MBL fold metallo-hydrolase [Desulfosoma caldarium]|uniref:L-ascorbate metabolism protein UlaG (Beta-lactamase superfamily) n=1 Tax=Desulfosoma caldarium TaxID=610254 RepID=A0A3N1UEM9_9BACT|nr:MBL fold metallo-hydrolase [Desulfosoma caldarium]ROQ89825.1 L-ascorbate metabolism protein UlaG (beta-lactamase superfamily) [Desulfosoma caldarium]
MDQGCSIFKNLVIGVAAFGVGFLGMAFGTRAAEVKDVQALVEKIHWLGHDSFRIDGKDAVVYIDPYRIKDGPPADLILITHEHSDHASPADVAKIRKADSVIVTTAAAAAKFSGDIRTVKPGDALTVRGVGLRALPAYNLTKFRSPGVPFHPKEAGHVGFLITVDGLQIYHAGDTDHIPEMAGLAPDVALLPVSGTYVMTAEEAVRAAAAIGPRVAVPMHVGEGIGSLDDAARFKAMATVPVIVLPLEK